MEFSVNLSERIFDLHCDLKNRKYRHGGYHAFNISDPKPRNIHKASVRDRLLHHAIYRVLYPYFDSKFIYDSYSCRKWKGTHRALDRFKEFGRKASCNNRKTVWVLKCDVRKFFASIDHEVLMTVVKVHISDTSIIELIERVVSSFESTTAGKGLPLGNLTSQLLVNIYMNWFDHYVKHSLKARYYMRYADDFVIMDTDRVVLEKSLQNIQFFLKENLLLDLHPDKVFIKTLASGVDFLGWIHFPRHRVLRTTTKKRMLRNLKCTSTEAMIQSYLGMLKHGNTEKLRKMLKDKVKAGSSKK